MSLDLGDPFGALSSLRGPLRKALENEAFKNLNEAERIRLAAELLKLQGQAGHSSFKSKPLQVVNG